MTTKEFLNRFELIKKNSKNKDRICMHPGCNLKAIKSHVLQKNGILKEISFKNHLFQFNNVSSFQVDENGKYELKRIGINDVFTFPGFCKIHDTEVFKSIENEKNIDLTTRKSICLFSYRTLCQEIRRKEIALDIAEGIINTNFNINIILYYTDFKIGLLNGIKNLTFFKEQLEEEIEKQNYNFIVDFCEIKKTEICISGPQNIYDKNNPQTLIYDKNGKKLNNPFTTSIINIFPYKEKSIVMIAYHKDYKCNWTEELFKKFKSSKDEETLKLISDLITTRFEFWCISPTLKEQLKKDNILKLFSIWENEVFNFNYNLNTNFNLFK